MEKDTKKTAKQEKTTVEAVAEVKEEVVAENTNNEKKSIQENEKADKKEEIVETEQKIDEENNNPEIGLENGDPSVTAPKEEEESASEAVKEEVTEVKAEDTPKKLGYDYVFTWNGMAY